MKFDHATKWYMHKPESVLKNEIHKIFWDFEIQKDHPILGQKTRLSNSSQKKTQKKKIQILDFAIPDNNGVKIKDNKKGDKYLDLPRKLKKKKSYKT